MNIHPGHTEFPVALDHAQEFPALPFIKADLAGHKMGRRDALAPLIFQSHIQKLPGDPPGTVTFFRVYGADIVGSSFLGMFSNS